MTETEIEKIKLKVIPVLKKHGVKKASMFGSFMRGEEKENSDVDILVEIKRNISLLDFIGLKQEVEEALKRKVDLVEYNTIKPFLRERILANNIKII